MFTKIVLIVVFFSADGNGYRDVIGAFDSAKECEAAKAQEIADWRRGDPDAYVFAICVKPRSVNAVDV